jgi:hypothetical protein
VLKLRKLIYLKEKYIYLVSVSPFFTTHSDMAALLAKAIINGA